MDQKERDVFLAFIKQKEEAISENKKASKSFLIGAGIVTTKGKLKKQYQNLCIPQEQD